MPLAVTLTVVFAVLNILGAKQSTKLIRVLVLTLLAILGFFILHGVVAVASKDPATLARTQFTPFFTEGVDGLLGMLDLLGQTRNLCQAHIGNEHQSDRPE